MNATFDGYGKIGLEKVGAMDGNSRKTVIASKREQVESTISDFNAGTITADEAVQRLAGHRADILTLAQASTDAKNSEVINDANTALTAIDRSIWTSAAGIAGNVQAATAPVFQSRMGSAGNRPL